MIHHSSVQNFDSPAQINFFLISVNYNEKEGIDSVFNFKNTSDEFGLEYKWGVYPNKFQKKIIVAHYNTNDEKYFGVYEPVKKIVENIRPDFILCIGTAGGYDDIKLGDIVISRLVHYYNYTKPGNTEDNNIPTETFLMPPDNNLYTAASKMIEDFITITKNDKNLNKIFKSINRNLRKIDSVTKIDKICNIVTSEFCSGGKIHSRLDSEEMKVYTKYYPKAKVYEMESGIIGRAIYECYSNQNVKTGYLVIKGISDIIDTHSDTEMKTKIRNTIGKFVSHMSALFSKYLIENYIKGFSPIEGERLKKIEDISHGILNKSLSGVFHKVDAKDYSEFAGNNLINFLETKFIDKKTFFTVFAITPHQFYDLILSEYQKAKNISHTEEIEINDLFDFVKTKYPHFIIFNQNCDGKLLSNTVRILIMNENYPYRSDIRTLDEWKLFKLCNGNIPCWVIRRADLENTFVKDFAIIGDKILLDWDSKGEILTIIDIDMNTSLKPILIRLKETFYKFKLKIGISNAIFIWIDEFDNQIKKLFNYRNSHLFPAFRFANYLPSIVEQRKNQKQILNQYLPESALFIGCGYGDELDTILNSNSFASNCRKIQAIDIAKDVQAHFYLQPEINGLKTKVEYQNINLFELPRDNEPNSWECIQCGFVLEDIHYDDKEDAIERIHKVLNHNGILIISEIFLDNDSNNDNERGTQRVKEVETFYNLVLDEAQHVGINTEFEKGIKRACKNAKLGIRDYFETQKQIKNRLIDKKRFKIIQTIPNSKNRFMGIILAQKI